MNEKYYIQDTNRIYLNPNVIEELQNYLKSGAPYEQ